MSTPEVPRNVLGEHAEALVSDVLDKREQAIINSVWSLVRSGKTLDPQFAMQQWLALSELRTLRSTLVNRSKLESSRIAAQG